MSPPMIAGLYPYRRAGVTRPPVVTLKEIPQCLDVNPWYREELLVLAGDGESRRRLEGFGLKVERVFDDAPESVQRDAAHKMKHWMCLWALREFGEFLWVDWDTVCVRRPDSSFWEWTRAAGTPRFIRIPDYWATVNCGVYYAPGSWTTDMAASFGAVVEEPNDELLWRSVLPADVVHRSEFWWGPKVVHVQTEAEISLVTAEALFVHTKDLSWASAIRDRAAGNHE